MLLKMTVDHVDFLHFNLIQMCVYAENARGDHITKMELHYLYRGVTKTINLQTAH